MVNNMVNHPNILHYWHLERFYEQLVIVLRGKCNTQPPRFPRRRHNMASISHGRSHSLSEHGFPVHNHVSHVVTEEKNRVEWVY